MTQYVLFGAGSCGREILAAMRKKGVEPVCFADNNEAKWCKKIEGVTVYAADACRISWPDATWIATIYRHEASEVRQQMKQMGVKTEPLTNWLPLSNEPIPFSAYEVLRRISDDTKTRDLINDQRNYRMTLDLEYQIPSDDLSKIYFPDFITKIDNEVFVDCGAYDGDTVEAFLKWQPKPKAVFALEPDPENYRKLQSNGFAVSNLFPIVAIQFAASDSDGEVMFKSEKGVASCVDSGSPFDYRKGSSIACIPLQQCSFANDVTFIKMDIEGHEPQALWGARRILKEHRPVLAICAYHEPSHLWEIPLLIHAIQPNYHFRLRRYAEGAQELVWYCIPEERLKDQ